MTKAPANRNAELVSMGLVFRHDPPRKAKRTNPAGKFLGHGLIIERIPGRRCGNWYFVLCGSVRFTRR
jgi:hypothetical protein